MTTHTTREPMAPFQGPHVLAMQPEALGRMYSPFDAPVAPYKREGAVAVIDVEGPIMQRGGWLWDGYDAIGERIAHAFADESIEAVCLRLNSPGGAVAGCFESVSTLLAAKNKPVVAYVDECAFSACYAVAMLADEIILPPTGAVGSIGVIAAYVDMTKALDAAGIRVAVVASGTKKTDTHPAVPLTDAAIGRLRADVEYLAGQFFELVSKRRQMSVEAVRATQAGILYGKAAVDAGLADDVGSWRDALARAEALAREEEDEEEAGGLYRATTGDTHMSDPKKPQTPPVEAFSASLIDTISRAEHNAAISALTSTVNAKTEALAAAEARIATAHAALEETHAKLAKVESARQTAKVAGLVGVKITAAQVETFGALIASNETTFDAIVATLPELGLAPGAARVIPESGASTRSTDANADAAIEKQMVDRTEKRMASLGETRQAAMRKVMAEMQSEGLFALAGEPPPPPPTGDRHGLHPRKL